MFRTSKLEVGLTETKWISKYVIKVIHIQITDLLKVVIWEEIYVYNQETRSMPNRGYMNQ